ncbi:hypothetical protein DTW94_18445 [Streptomyces cavourensis]|uniref:Uncharacterized protein n=2 Tax=Streptomyces cavourensis TaxID=67258 RepID=A0AAD0Q618_9ACTN|nr:hypothetical protein DTW94_18445 [Streptomyces cavourensis]
MNEGVAMGPVTLDRTPRTSPSALLSAPVQPPPAVQTPYPQSSAAAVPRHPAPSAERAGAGAVRPSLLAGEELDAPDPHIFRGTD